MMKNFFKKEINKDNPFVEQDKGDDQNIMSEDVKETEKQETENSSENKEKETAETSEKAAEENAAEKEKDTRSEADKLKLALESLNNQYLRLAADFDNYRKRQAQEREALIKFGAEECMKKVLEVVDNFDRALNMVEKIDNLDKMKETFFVLHKQLTESLTKLGLEQIKCVGEKFDPNLHEAVMQTQTEEYPEETVIEELQKGYKYGEKVLRPAMVSVAVK